MHPCEEKKDGCRELLTLPRRSAVWFNKWTQLYPVLHYPPWFGGCIATQLFYLQRAWIIYLWPFSEELYSIVIAFLENLLDMSTDVFSCKCRVCSKYFWHLTNDVRKYGLHHLKPILPVWKINHRHYTEGVWFSNGSACWVILSKIHTPSVLYVGFNLPQRV